MTDPDILGSFGRLFSGVLEVTLILGFSRKLVHRLLNEFQRGFPLVAEPFLHIAKKCGCTEAEVMSAFARLREHGVISRIGPVFAPKKVGCSTLAAMAIPPDRLEEVAVWISGLPEVNHNYEREHELNLWFVATARDEEHLLNALTSIKDHTGIEVHDLRLMEEYRIDLGFEIPETMLLPFTGERHGL